MTVYNVIYTRTDAHNFVTEVQVRGTSTDYDDALKCFNDTKVQIIANDPKYKIAEKEKTVREADPHGEIAFFCFWVDSTGVDELHGGYTYSDYYEVTLRIVQSIVKN